MTVIYHFVYGNYGGCSGLLSRIITICSVPINVRPKHDVEGKCEEQGDTKLTGYKADIGRTCDM